MTQTATAPIKVEYRAWPDVACIIPARGGSRGLPKKNIAILAGKPLLAWSIIQAQDAGIEDVFVTTDDEEIGAVAEEYGARFIRRPPEISGEFSPSEEALLHALSIIKRPEIVIFLQATSPVRKASEIMDAVDMVASAGYDSVLSGVRLHQFVWRVSRETGVAWSVNYDPVGGMRPMRQLIEDYIENGSIYCFRTSLLEQTGKRLGGRIGVLEMPYWSRFEIDTGHDLETVEWIFSMRDLW